jgi:hypothetical protein
LTGQSLPDWLIEASDTASASSEPLQDDAGIVADSDKEELRIDDEFHLKSVNITAAPCSFLRNAHGPWKSSVRELTVKEIAHTRLEAWAAKRAHADAQPKQSKVHK